SDRVVQKPRHAPFPATMSRAPGPEARVSFADALDVLYEDNHLVAVNKPSGWPSAHFGGSEETLDRVVKAYLKDKPHNPGTLFLGVVHRLAQPGAGRAP